MLKACDPLSVILGLVVILLFWDHLFQNYAAAQSNISSIDQNALLALKSSIYDPNNILATNWSTTTSVCSWIGVSCNNATLQRVTALNLSSMGLDGSIPQDIGEIPSGFGSLPNLEALFLGRNRFSGIIPPSICNISTLRELRLRSNKLSGNIPEGIGNLARLEILDLFDNLISGSIPVSAFNLSSLRIMLFSRNRLSVSLSDDTCQNLPRLEWLDLGSNQIVGKIPPGLGKCKQLKRLNLQYNKLSGRIPAALANLTQLEELKLATNSLTGELGSLYKLKKLSIRNNTLKVLAISFDVMNPVILPGTIPSDIGEFRSLERLYLWGNELHGNIPISIGNASRLTLLEFSHNRFSGPVPNSLGNLKQLRLLNLDTNYLTDLSFISSLANCKELRIIHLSFNPFNTTLPASIGNLSAVLEQFAMAGCKIKGNIPGETGNLSSLTKLYLGDNELTGPIPTTIGRLKKLQGLSLYNNSLEGSIPSEICQLSYLFVLSLDYNKLAGSMPACLGSMTSMRALHLEANNLAFRIPSSFWNLKDVLYVNLSSNSLSGELPLSIGNLKVSVMLDLSSNHFSGVIPSTLGSLQNLKYLSLAYNTFQGPVPESFGKFESMEELDLSSNNLSGAIPKSFENLTSLKYLNEIRDFVVDPCQNFQSARIFLQKEYGLEGIVSTRGDVYSFGILLMETFTRNKPTDEMFGEGMSLKDYVQKALPDSVAKIVDEHLLSEEKHLLSKIKCLSSIFTLAMDCVIEFPEQRTYITEVLATLKHIRTRYLADTYGLQGIVSTRGDVYSFGILLMETFTRKKPTDEMFGEGMSLKDYVNKALPDSIAKIVDEHLLSEEEHLLAKIKCFTSIFTLAMNCLEKRTDITEVLATLKHIRTRYLADTYGLQGIVSTRGDVYSFGILLMETFTRKKPTDEMFGEGMSLKDYVNKALPDSIAKIVDEHLLSEEEHLLAKIKCFTSIFTLAMNCLEKRTDITEVLATLKHIRTRYLADTDPGFPSIDQNALLALKSHITYDPNNILATKWSTTISVCSWIGVSCNNATLQRVTALNLSSIGLEGSIPQDIGNLSFLVMLNLTDNRLAGDIPSGLGSLTNLEALFLGRNRFSGIIPPSICNISTLRELRLRSNKLSGSIPEGIGNLARLEILDLFDNLISGSIPVSAFNLSALRIMFFSRNRLSHSLSDDTCQSLPGLQVLDIGRNQIVGKIPPGLGKCKQLIRLIWIGISYNNATPQRVTSLNLSSVGLEGSIPPDIGNLSFLAMLDLSNNRLTGEIPSGLGSLPKLEALFLAGNRFLGIIPPSICNISTLRELRLGSNKLSGNIPKGIGNLTRLEILDLVDNLISGSIPVSAFNLSSLRMMILNRNRLSDSLSDDTCQNLARLQVLDIDRNQIVGKIPPGLGKCKQLFGLNLRDNKLTGSIPTTLANLTQLEELYLDNNGLHGNIPISIGNASRLTLLEIRNNALTGPIPNSLGNLRELQLLSLAFNSLTDLRFISSLANCKELRIMDLSFNPLNTTLPASIGNLSAVLDKFSMARCKIKGNIPEEIGNLNSLTSLDLGDNELTRPIPTTIGRMKKLQGLNLYNNSLEGSISSEICQLNYLSALSLKYNKLVGAIPACLGSMTSMRILHLGANNLAFPIPSSFWNFKDILYVNLSSNSLSGQLPLSIGNLKVIVVLDLSRNHFSGVIPSTMGSLQNLQYLSLAYNTFQGPVPETLGNLISVEVLDLSSNNLSGAIPKSFEKLTSLEHLNVSFNSLQGEIPSGGPFKNFSVEGDVYSFGILLMETFTRKKPTDEMFGEGMSLKDYVNKALPDSVAKIVDNHLLSEQEHFSAKIKGDVYSFGILLMETFTRKKPTNEMFGEGMSPKDYVKKALPNSVAKILDLSSNNLSGAIPKSFEKLTSLQYLNVSFNALQGEIPSGGPFKNFEVDSFLGNKGFCSGSMPQFPKCKNISSEGSKTSAGHLLKYILPTTISTMLVASFIFLLIEYGSEGIVSTKGDVYSFGIVLMEMFTRKKPTDEIFNQRMSLRDYVKDALPNSVAEIADANLKTREQHLSAAMKECIHSVFALAVDCTVESPEERADITKIVTLLKSFRNEYLAKIAARGGGQHILQLH
ncbi:hypothetical protein Tsubulata_015838 [Turnera subulata]|uniref:Leucine-rich repeat-containing N-terminal plant-type domain-containing protein n=1 Tax=Turnera subulata TaxID=218843 RepID=A0A9Q0JPG8_9ROSI|nr:hypothetical protein Tsubulata_015838 [Turnera subulata]